jgi:hypothetical protein
VKVRQIPDRTPISIGVQQVDALAATIREFLLATPRPLSEHPLAFLDGASGAN